jgi:predicted Zn-dependent protease
MRASFALSSLVVAAMALGIASASAETPKTAAAGSSGSKEVRKDPEGKRGISPYAEAIAKGEGAYVARDLPGAITSFQDAIKLDTEKMLGFFRLGEAQLETGKPDEADSTWQTALGKKGTDDLNAKLLFVIADLRERQHKWQAAKDAWAAYSAFLQNHTKVNGYPATATERTKQADRRMKDEVDYGAVKDRIAKRELERTKEAEENAKKDKLNR